MASTRTSALQDQPGSSIDKPKHRHPQSHAEKLEDAAAAAALLAAGKASKKSSAVLDKDQKLSSAGAAASLKYADPQSLPSFPVVGVKNDSSASGKAATLGWNNQQTFEHWKPDASPSAAAAALLAKDYKMNPSWKPESSDHGLTAAKLAHKSSSKVTTWQPEASANGAKAALFAHKDNKGVDAWKPESSSWGNSAANLAFKKQIAVPSPPNNDAVLRSRHHSHLAATGAVAGRRRADSTPAAPRTDAYPDESNAAVNAVKAAAKAAGQRGSVSPSKGASAQSTARTAAMLTSQNTSHSATQGTNKDEILQASAIAMAKSMYQQQSKPSGTQGDAHSGANSAHSQQRLSTSTTSNKTDAPRTVNLQEAAQKLAQARLSKLYNESEQTKDYRNYYSGQTASPVPSRRLTLLGRVRRRASSMDEDHVQSARIRAQMSLFSTNLSTVDDEKRKADREALLAVAQRNVHKQMHGMDEQVFESTGKVGPTLLEDWEKKAQATAQAKSDARMENHGKVDVGGGMFINQSDVDAVAARNVQPVLDDINEKAEISREKQAALKAEQEKNAKLAAENKMRDQESKTINKQLAQQDKEEAHARKAKEKERKAEEKRLAKEKRTSTGLVVASEHPDGSTTEPTPSVVPTAEQSTEPRTSTEDGTGPGSREHPAPATTSNDTPLSPSGGAEGGRVKSWLKKTFSIRHSRTASTLYDDDHHETKTTDKEPDVVDHETAPKAVQDSPTDPDDSHGDRLDSIGGSKQAESEYVIPNPVQPHDHLQRTATHVSSDSELSDDVAAAGKRGRESNKDGYFPRIGAGALAVGGRRRRHDTEGVSPLSSDSDDDKDNDEFTEARDGLADNLLPPPTLITGDRKSDKGKGSPASGSRFRESLEEL